MKHFFLCTALTILFCTCKKDDQDCPQDLPCATQVGANTFGCYINGEPWVSGIAPNILAPELHEFEVEYDEIGYGMFHNNFMRVSASRINEKTDGFISINIKPVVGTVISNNDNSISLGIYGVILTLDNGNITKNTSFNLDTLFEYRFEITHLDTNKNIASGNFFFTGTSFNDTVKVTDGRFDVMYDPY